MHKKQRKNIFKRQAKKFSQLSDIFLEELKTQGQSKSYYVIKNHTNPSLRQVNMKSQKKEFGLKKYHVLQQSQKINSNQSIIEKVMKFNQNKEEQALTTFTQQYEKTGEIKNRQNFNIDQKEKQQALRIIFHNSKRPGLKLTLHEQKNHEKQSKKQNFQKHQLFKDNKEFFQKDEQQEKIQQQYFAGKIKPFFL